MSKFNKLDFSEIKNPASNTSVQESKNKENSVSDLYLTKGQQKAIDNIHLERWDDNTPGMSTKDAKRWLIYCSFH